jgi:hypothetical protein
MLIEEYPWNGRIDRIRHYSDAGMLIEQVETGRRYIDAIDVYPTAYTYTETDEPIPEPEPPEPEEEPTLTKSRGKSVEQLEKEYAELREQIEKLTAKK